MTYEMMTLYALVLSIAGNLYFFTKNERLRRVIQAAVDKAERDRAEMVRIPFNQLLKLGFSSRHGFYRDREFNHKPGPHPAVLSAARRRKL